jgi:hypothetical protein
MAYVTADLCKMAAGLLEDQTMLWIYRNTAGDSEATIKGAGFFADAWQHGVKAGDLCFVANVANAANAWAILSFSATAPTKAAPGGTLAANVVVT